MEQYDVVIVGAGQGGAQAAIALRQAKFAGSIALLGKEPELPYERPPLSKDYLSGERTFDRLLIRPAPFWAERQIVLGLGREVVGVDPGRHRLLLADGRSIGYGRLIWAAGGAPRRLTCAGHDLMGMHTVRTRADADRLIAEMPRARSVVVIGGGYIGLEAAAVLTKASKRITVLEALDRVLARVAGEPLSRFYEHEHRLHGVDIRLGAKVACIEGRSGRAEAVRLDTGELVAGDLVIVGIGIQPDVRPLLEAGATGGDGVAVDARCRTSLADVYAIGDCARHVNPFGNGSAIRLESVQNANDQAKVVAQAISGAPVDYHSVPWFWSDQYDLKLQTVGLSGGHDDLIVRGDPSARSFSVVYLRQGRVIALDCVNATKDFVQGRTLVVNRSRIASSSLADTNVPLKDLVTPAAVTP